MNVLTPKFTVKDRNWAGYDIILWKGMRIPRPILKSDPRHPQWKPPMGESTIDVSSLKWGDRSYLITLMTVVQEDSRWRVINYVLENGLTIESNSRWEKGVCPLLKWVFNPDLFWVDLGFKEPEASYQIPEDSYFWEYYDLGLTKDPDRATEARRITPDREKQYSIYHGTLVPLEALRECKDYEEYLKIREYLEAIKHKSNCSPHYKWDVTQMWTRIGPTRS